MLAVEYHSNDDVRIKNNSVQPRHAHVVCRDEIARMTAEPGTSVYINNRRIRGSVALFRARRLSAAQP